MNENKSQFLRYMMLFLVIIGSITWGLIGMFNYNLVHSILMGNTMAKKVAYSLIGIAGLYLALNPNTWRPDREECVFPAHLLMHCEDATQGKKMVITTKQPNTSIVYWAKNEKNGELFNSGTAKTNNMGLATIVLAQPDKDHDIPGFWSLPKEIFYRGISGTGTLSRVESTKI